MPKISELQAGAPALTTDLLVVARGASNVRLQVGDIAALIPAGEQGPQGLQGDPGPAGSDATVTKAAVEAVLTGEITSHTHPASGGDISAAWPVGSVFMSVVATDPATLLGFGTWAAFGAGRMPVGFDATQTEFDTLEETGGAKTHTLQISEMPAHTHVITSQTATTGAATSYEHGVLDTSSAEAEATEVTGSTGGGAAHNNLPPYIVVRLWKRTA